MCNHNVNRLWVELSASVFRRPLFFGAIIIISRALFSETTFTHLLCYLIDFYISSDVREQLGICAGFKGSLSETGWRSPTTWKIACCSVPNNRGILRRQQTSQSILVKKATRLQMEGHTAHFSSLSARRAGLSILTLKGSDYRAPVSFITSTWILVGISW